MENAHGKMKIFLETLKNELTAEDIDTHLEGCIGCGNCGHACAWFLVSNDQARHPKNKSDLLRKIYKAFLTPEGRFLAKIGLIRTPDEKDLSYLQKAVWECCTTCGRCSLACPQGVSNRRLTYLSRMALSSASIMPPIVREIRNNCLLKKHSFGASSFEEALGKAIGDARNAGLAVPIDVMGSDFLWVCSAIANTKIWFESKYFASVLNVLDVSYTISSRLLDSGTEAQTLVVDMKISREYLEDIENEAIRLKVKALIIPECGCDIRTFVIDASRILGRPFKFPVVYVDTLILDLLGKKNIPMKKLDIKVTYHDPCKSGRETGFIDEPRELLRSCVRDLIEMTPNREMNYCCNGGAGPMRVYPPDELTKTNLRREVSVLKKEQIIRTGADYVVTPCATCFLSLQDTVKFYGLKTEVKLLINVVYESIKNALEERNELDRMRTPINMRGL